ncbi:MAG: 50S ribosomal protein L9 [Planctomycetes bacterium]|jgi:large subunit ribosomal protein L9|nr:50S ribosomal protein L9 [Planctomycetota bacterium]
MELLLLQNVPGLGKAGEIVTVSRGYARNFLLPKRLAEVPSEQAIRVVRAKTARIEAELEKEKAARMEQAKGLASVTVEIAMKAGEGGQLYGSVGAKQIAEYLSHRGHAVDEKQVRLDEHLKAVGEFDVNILLHPEVQVPVKVVITAEGEK